MATHNEHGISIRRCLAALLIGFSGAVHAADTPDPRELIRAAMDHWRGLSSYSEMTMTVHRSDWQSQHTRAMRAGST